MATLERHCEAARQKFGQPYEEIHRWLDAFCGTELYHSRHRQVRHHETGIVQAGHIFGKYAEEVARQHIIIDLMEEGWQESDPFPQNENHYRSLGFW